MVERNVGQFDADVASNEGYLYTTNARRSSLMANRRLTDLTRDMVSLEGRRVLDVGCGDGTYSHQLFEACKPASLLGVDAAEMAIELATRRFSSSSPALSFECHDVGSMPYAPGSFDLAIARGLLHHLEDPEAALHRIAAVAREVFVIEPNGYNPVLKLIECLSAYHRAHEERSYAPLRLRSWIGNLGGTLLRDRYAGLVPFFCPDWMAVTLKAFEPLVETLPLGRQLCCAVYAVLFRTGGGETCG